MFAFLHKLFRRLRGAADAEPELGQAECEAHAELKTRGLEAVLGPMADVVGHAIVPFELGGAVDMYYFPQPGGGTAFATMELITPYGSGPVPNDSGTYELVAFTRHPYDRATTDGESTAFDLIERRVCGLFTRLGNYSSHARLAPGDTCELPSDDEPDRCLLFDDWGSFEIGEAEHGLLLCIEVHRSEMEFAMQHGPEEILGRLREAGVYPNSDLDREPVV